MEDQIELPFPVMEMNTTRYKLTAFVTSRNLPGHELIQWYRQRCGNSEQAHAILKDDLGGACLPSGSFGENAAWWAITVLAFNLNTIIEARIPESQGEIVKTEDKILIHDYTRILVVDCG